MGREEKREGRPLILSKTIRLTHGKSREISVGTSTIPISRHWFRIHRNNNSKIFGRTMQQKSAHPQIVTHGNTFAGSNLELPLGGHHLSICARNIDTRIQTGSVMGFDDISTVNLISSHSAIVWALGSGPC